MPGCVVGHEQDRGHCSTASGDGRSGKLRAGFRPDREILGVDVAAVAADAPAVTKTQPLDRLAMCQPAEDAGLHCQ